jgi:serine protease
MKTSILATSLGAAALLFGCGVDEPTFGTTAGMSFEQFQAKAIRDPNGGYVVEWDIYLPNDEALRKYWESNQAQGQGLTLSTLGGGDNKWSETQKIALTYCISTTTFTDPNEYNMVKAAFEFATENGWEMFGDLDFIHRSDQDATCTNTNPNVLFDVNRVSGQPYLARAFFPPPGDEGAGRAQANVLIDASSFQGGLPWPLQNIVGHELGHVLGFRHEHVRPEAMTGPNDCPEGDDFRPLTTYDSNSIMHYPQCNGTSPDLAFTAIDKMGTEVAYGPPIPNLPPMTMINKPSDGATLPPTFAIETSVIDEDLVKVDLFIDNMFYASKLAANAPFNFDAMNLTPGPHEIKMVGTDMRNQMGMQVINITVEEESGCCSAGGSPAGAGLLAGLTFLGLVVQRRRRRP